jgi:large subunit ribosomal protein L17
MITLGKRGDLHARRQALSYIRDKDVVAKVFSELSDRYRSRMGGYTRIVKVGNRPGDNAPVSFIECIKDAEEKKPKRKAASKKS